MRVSTVIAQTPVTWDVEQNLATITGVVAGASPGDVVVLPEGALSGYGDDLSYLDRLDPKALDRASGHVAGLARGKGVHLFCGSLHFDRGAWWNVARYFSPQGTTWTYRKINLATHERGRLEAGSALPTLDLRVAGGSVTVGVQICREIRFPEQWQHLAARGARAFVYLTHAVNPAEPPGVWRSHLISRAAENQRFVLAANAAAPYRHCPSMVVSPRGEVLAELETGRSAVLRTIIDLDEAGTWYLGQRRRDVVRLHHD